MPQRSKSTYSAARRYGYVTIELRFDDGQLLARVTRQGRGFGQTFRPLLLGSTSFQRAGKLLDALLAEMGPGHGGDVVHDQLTLWSDHG